MGFLSSSADLKDGSWHFCRETQADGTSQPPAPAQPPKRARVVSSEPSRAEDMPPTLAAQPEPCCRVQTTPAAQPQLIPSICFPTSPRFGGVYPSCCPPQGGVLSLLSLLCCAAFVHSLQKDIVLLGEYQPQAGYPGNASYQPFSYLSLFLAFPAGSSYEFSFISKSSHHREVSPLHLSKP